MNSRSLLALLFLVVTGGLFVLLNKGDEASRANLSDRTPDVGATVVPTYNAANIDAPERPAELEQAAEERSVAPELASGMGDEEPEEQFDDRAFSGTVVDTFGRGVEGARVWLGPASSRFSFSLGGDQRKDKDAALTDADGHFSMQAPGSPSLRVAVRASGFAPLVETDRTSPKDGELGELVLQPGAILSGRVVSDLGLPLENARLRVEPQQQSGLTIVSVFSDRAPADAITSADGRFVLDELATGPYVVRVHHPLHPNQEAKGQCEQPGRQLGELTIQMDAGGSASGLVHGWRASDQDKYEIIARPTGSDFIERARDARRGKITEHSAQSGGFEISGLRLGKPYEFFVERKNSFSAFAGDGKSPVVARAGEHGLVLEMHPRAGLEFRVVNAKTGAAVEDFTASAGRRRMESLKGEDGKTLRHHPDGRAAFNEVTFDQDRAALTIQADGFKPYRNDDVQVTAGSTRNLGDIRLQPMPILKVTVLDDLTAEPIAKARVQLKTPPEPQQSGMRVRRFDSSGGASKSTDEEGLAKLTTTPGKVMALNIQHDDYATLELPARTYGAEELVVRLSVGGIVRVIVRDSSGSPLPEARVDHRGPTGNREATGRADEEGICIFEHLGAGTHAFRISESSGSGGLVMVSSFNREPRSEGWTQFDVGLDTDDELVLVGAARGNLRGRLTVRGRALSGGTLDLGPWTEEEDPMAGMMFFGGNGGVQTDSSGSYEFKNKSVGEYRLTVNHPDRWMPTILRVTIQEGDNEFDAELGDTILEGRVVDTAGNGIAGATLRPVVASPGRTSSNTVMMISTTVSSGSGGGGIVQIGGPDSTAMSGEDGTFELHGVRPEVDITLKVTADGYQPGETLVKALGPNEVRSGIEIGLEVGSTLTVQVFDASGGQGGFGTVQLTRLSGGEDGKGDGATRFGSIQNGTVEVQGMAPGRWTMETTLYSIPGPGQTETPEPEVDTREIAVVEGEPTEAEVRF